MGWAPRVSASALQRLTATDFLSESNTDLIWGEGGKRRIPTAASTSTSQRMAWRTTLSRQCPLPGRSPAARLALRDARQLSKPVLDLGFWSERIAPAVSCLCTHLESASSARSHRGARLLSRVESSRALDHTCGAFSRLGYDCQTAIGWGHQPTNRAQPPSRSGSKW